MIIFTFALIETDALMQKSENQRLSQKAVISQDLRSNSSFVTKQISDNDTSFYSIATAKYTDAIGISMQNAENSYVLDRLNFNQRELGEEQNGKILNRDRISVQAGNTKLDLSISSRPSVANSHYNSAKEQVMTRRDELEESVASFPQEEHGEGGFSQQFSSAHKPRFLPVSLHQVSPKANFSSLKKPSAFNKSNPIANYPSTPQPKSNHVISNKPEPVSFGKQDNQFEANRNKPSLGFDVKSNLQNIYATMTQSSQGLNELLEPQLGQTNTSKIANSQASNSESIVELEFTRTLNQQPPNKLKMLRTGTNKNSMQNLTSIRDNSNDRCIPKRLANTSQGSGSFNTATDETSSMINDYQSSCGSSQASRMTNVKLSEKMNFKNAFKTLSTQQAKVSSQERKIPVPVSLVNSQGNSSNGILDGNQLPRNPLQKRNCSTESKTAGKSSQSLQNLKIKQTCNRIPTETMISPKAEFSNLSNKIPTQAPLNEERMLWERSNILQGGEFTRTSLRSTTKINEASSVKNALESFVEAEIISNFYPIISYLTIFSLVI